MPHGKRRRCLSKPRIENCAKMAGFLVAIGKYHVVFRSGRLRNLSRLDSRYRPPKRVCAAARFTTKPHRARRRNMRVKRCCDDPRWSCRGWAPGAGKSCPFAGFAFRRRRLFGVLWHFGGQESVVRNAFTACVEGQRTELATGAAGSPRIYVSEPACLFGHCGLDGQHIHPLYRDREMGLCHRRMCGKCDLVYQSWVRCTCVGANFPTSERVAAVGRLYCHADARAKCGAIAEPDFLAR